MLTFDDLAFVRRTYALTLTDLVRAQDLRVLFGRVGASPAHAAILLDWARENLPALQQKLRAPPARAHRGPLVALR